MIKRILIYLFRKKQKILWYFQYKRVVKEGLYPRNIKILDGHNLGNCLILVPHSDDELIGCSQIIQKSSNAQCVYFHFYGEDLSQKNINVRDQEIRKSSKINSFDLIHLKENHKEELRKLLSKHHFDQVFSPSPYDWHPQHRYVFECLYSLVKEGIVDSKIYYYNVSVPMSSLWDISIMPMTKDEQKDKWKRFLTIYHSQSFMPIYRYRLQERLNAINLYYAAETYRYCSDETILKDYNRIVKAECIIDLNKGVNLIQNIRKIRNWSNQWD